MNTHSGVGKGGKFNGCFREERLTSHAGVVRIKEVADRLGVEQILTEELSVKAPARGYSEGPAIGGLVSTRLLGGTCRSDLAVLRGDGGTQELLGVERMLAPPTAGEFLRKCDLGAVPDLPRVNLRRQQRGRPQQAATTCTLELDSSIYE